MMEDFKYWELKFKYCSYSNRLMDKLLSLNEKSEHKLDMVKVKKSIYYAKKFHGDQKRQSGEPYYSHPLEVAYMVSDYLFKTDIIVTCILHDTIEDTTMTLQMIESLFGPIVASQVEDLTRIKKDRKITSAEMVESLFSQQKYDVLLIKLFDRLHNIKTINFKSPDKIEKIVAETLERFLTVAMYLKIPQINNELVKLCYPNLSAKQSLLQDQRPILSANNFQLPSPASQTEDSQTHMPPLLVIQ